MNIYYERQKGFLFELCQNRFKDNPDHPWNVCAVATSHKKLVEMYNKYFSGGVDWLENQPS
jgi:hypothetical protein